MPAAAVLAVALAACSSGGDTDSGGAPVPAAGAGDVSLAGVCPETIVFQSDWFPQMEYGAYYGLLRGKRTVDAKRKRVTGDLVAGGKDTGVDLEIRSGGPALGGAQSVTNVMYSDPSITLGQITLDESIQNSADKPTVQVVAPMEILPAAIGWDRNVHPEFRTIADIGQTDTKVLYFQSDAYMQFLLGSGVLNAKQTDGSFDGSPARMAASKGAIAQQIFVTQQPYVYANELGDAKFDLDYQLVADAGYPLYGQGVTIRAADREKLAPCLRKLVPIVQQSQVDLMRDSTATRELVVDVVKQYRSFWTYSPGLARFTVEQMGDLGLVANGKDRTLGNFEEQRVQRLIDILRPIYAAQRKELRADLDPGDIVTNEFVDPSIALPASR